MNTQALRTAKKTVRKQHMPKSLEQRFISNGLSHLLDGVYSRTAELLAENSEAPKALHNHLEQILPCIAFYEALVKKTGSTSEALELFDCWAFDDLERIAAIFRRLMKTGIWRKAPAIADRLIDKAFGFEAGFRSVRIEGAEGFARDMLVCPYFETCKRYGCPEITQFFCKSDDITYGNMHPRLVWKRTQTLGTGGECCDFRLFVRR